MIIPSELKAQKNTIDLESVGIFMFHISFLMADIFLFQDKLRYWTELVTFQTAKKGYFCRTLQPNSKKGTAWGYKILNQGAVLTPYDWVTATNL
jgi:hypothetical protein